MPNRIDEGDDIRIRPTRLGVKNTEAAAWSMALTTVLRYASNSRKAGRNRSTAAYRYNGSQRCAVRVMYARNVTAGQWRAHGRYIARETVTKDHRRAGFDGDRTDVAPAKLLEKWQQASDPRLWKLIISPEFGDRLDLHRLTRELMHAMESDLGTKLEWVAVVHLNTQHPHIHVALRGVRDDGTPLQLDRDYIRNGIRWRAEQYCTNQLGFRSEVDAIESERREVSASRFTSLDRSISKSSVINVQDSNGEPAFFVFDTRERLQRPAAHRDVHVSARLTVLGAMGLAQEIMPGRWRVRRDFEKVLRAMQMAGDRQKMLAAHGAVLSDTRLQIEVSDWRSFRMLEGRIVLHGEDETAHAAGKKYLLVEGIDARAHLIYYTPDLEHARSCGKLRVNFFVRLRKQLENGRPVLDVEDLGDADALLGNKLHFESKARALVKRGIIPTEDGWGGWLGLYQCALAHAAATKRLLDRAPSEAVER